MPFEKGEPSDRAELGVNHIDTAASRSHCRPLMSLKEHAQDFPELRGFAGERTGLRVVAEHADIWASPSFTAADFRRTSAILDEHCAAIGRDPHQIIRSVQVFFTAQEPPPAGARYPGPAGARELPAELIDAGARHLVLACVGMPSARWAADEIVHPVLAATGSRLLLLSPRPPFRLD